jgi:hypothetical protein
VVISAIVAAALTGLQSLVMATPAQAEISCRLEDAGASSHWRASGAERCRPRAGRKVLARQRAALRAAHAELGETAPRVQTDELATTPEAQAAAHAEAGDAAATPRPAALHCVAVHGARVRRGGWELGIDRATGHRCWRLAGTSEPDADISPRPGRPRVQKRSVPPRHLTAANASAVTTPAAVEAKRPGQPPEVPTGTTAKPVEVQKINLGQSPVSAAPAPTGKPSDVDKNELPPFDLRFAWTADRSLAWKGAAPVSADTEPAKMPSANMLEAAATSMPTDNRLAVFLIVFSAVLVTVLTLYGLAAGLFKLLRATRHRYGAPAIRITPPLYLDDMTARDRAAFTDEPL